MAAEINNKYAQKHSREHVVAVLEDCITGILSYESIKEKTMSPVHSSEQTVLTGYSCIERALASHGHYKGKLCEWEITHKDDEEVSELIKRLREISNEMIIANTVEGHYPASVGIFLMKCKLGMVEKGVEMSVPKEPRLIKVHSVSPDGTKTVING